MNKHLIRGAALAALAVAPFAHAQGAAAGPTVAVLSLVGDTIDIVSFQEQTGHLNDPNVHQVVPFAAAQLDYEALRAARDVLAKAEPGADIALLAASDPEALETPERMFTGESVKLPPDIDAAVRREHASQLVLMTKYRADSRMALSNGAIGNGKVKGLGFYLDNVHMVRDGDTGELSRGFIAPFAYVRLSLIDVASGKVLREAGVTESVTLSTSRNQAGTDAWGTLTPQEKVTALRELLHRAVAENLPAVVGASAPAGGPAAAPRP